MNAGASAGAAAAAGLVAALGLLTLVWVASLVRKDASLVDRVWGLGFVILAWVYRAAAEPGPSGSEAVRGLAVAMVTLWGLRLAAYLTWRNWGHGEDSRYRAMRARGGPNWPFLNLFTVHWGQALVMWVVSLPVLAAVRGTASAGHPLVWLGVALWLLGFGFETVGDLQLVRFKADPANKGKVLDRGLWRYTRHPNYFGDACVWWGIFGLAAASGAWWTVIGPLVMNGLLVKVSGVALLEKQLAKTKPQYRDYIRRTSAFLPRPPRPAS